MDAYIACIFVMLLTVIVAVIEFFAINWVYKKQQNTDTTCTQLTNAVKLHETGISSLSDKISLIRTKHYENLADELSEAHHLIKNLEGKMDSLQESQRRFEAKITQRLRRNQEPLSPIPDNGDQYAPGYQVEEPANKKKFGAYLKEA